MRTRLFGWSYNIPSLFIRRFRFERILFVSVKYFPEFSFAKKIVEQSSPSSDALTIATENSKWMGNFVHLYREFWERLCMSNTAFSPSCAQRRRKTGTHASISSPPLTYFTLIPFPIARNSLKCSLYAMIIGHKLILVCCAHSVYCKLNSNS